MLPTQADLANFCDTGLDKLPESKAEETIGRYAQFDHPAAREVVAWLRGETQVGEECLTT